MSANIDSNRDKARLSALAVASIVLGILGFATLWVIGGLLLAGAGAVLGHLAIHDIRFSNGRHYGTRVARTGLVICYLAIATFPLIGIGVVASLPTIKDFQASKNLAKSESSRKNASQLFIACEQYSRANKGRYPRNWDQLAGAFLSEGEISTLLQSPYPEAEGHAFELVPHERPILPAVASSVVVIQERAPSNAEKVAIVYANGKVDLIENPNRFQ